MVQKALDNGAPSDSNVTQPQSPPVGPHTGGKHVSSPFPTDAHTWASGGRCRHPRRLLLFLLFLLLEVLPVGVSS